MKSKQVEENLIPLLLGDDRLGLEDMINTTEKFIEEITQPRTTDEAKYLELMTQAIYQPELLFSDYPSVLQAVLSNPRMMWKLENLKKLTTNTCSKAVNLQ